MNDFAIEKGFFLLQQGKILCTKDGCIIHMDESHSFIRYSHFGSSAVEATKEQLAWVLDNIMKTRDFLVFSNINDVYLSFICNTPRSLWLFMDGEYDGYDPVDRPKSYSATEV